MAETICHFELMSNDPAKSRAFYSQIFNWKFKDEPQMGGYTMIDTGGEPGGGLFAKPAEVPKPSMNIYIQVQSIEETLGKVRRAGGKIISEKTQIPNIGYWAMFLDPDEICVGIFEPLPR